MPWTEELPNGRYRAIWRDTLGRKRSKSGFTQQAMALRYAGEQESKTRRGEAGYQGRSVTWGQWCDAWKGLRRIERSTADSDDARIERWLRPRWGNVPMARIDPEDVQLWVIELSGLMSAASVHKVYRLLSASLNAAVRHKRIGASACVGVELPIVPPSNERFLTRGEVDLTLHYMIEPYRTAAIILVGTGMRFGEMAGLHRNRIDWTAAAIDVHEVWDGQQIKAYPKGRKKRRVPLPSWVGEAILALPNDDARGCGLTHGDGRRLVKGRCTSDLVIRGPHGAPLNSGNMLRRHWASAVSRAGLEHARQHDLRHTFASWLVQAGRSMTEIAEVLGHSETTVTARYAHLAGTHMDAVRRVMEGLAPGSPEEGAPFSPLDLGEEAG